MSTKREVLERLIEQLSEGAKFERPVTLPGSRNVKAGIYKGRVFLTNQHSRVQSSRLNGEGVAEQVTPEV